jgi:hypothetical protein
VIRSNGGAWKGRLLGVDSGLAMAVSISEGTVSGAGEQAATMLMTPSADNEFEIFMNSG